MNPTTCTLFILAFASPPRNRLSKLNSFTHWPIMQKVRQKIVKILWLISVSRFRIFFTPFPRVLFTFPSRYLFTIGLNNIFRQRRWSSLNSNTSVFYFKQTLTHKNTGLSPSVVKDPTLFWLHITVFVLSAFFRQYLRNLGWFLFLKVLRCFSSLRHLICVVFHSGDSLGFEDSLQVTFRIVKRPVEC